MGVLKKPLKKPSKEVLSEEGLCRSIMGILKKPPLKKPPLKKPSWVS